MERRLTTIVAADIAGFSRLIGLDEEGTLAAQRAHRADLLDPLIAEHGGRIANTAGDSLLIEFSSAVQAVRCAVAMQDGMAARNADVAVDRRIAYRIGINIGDVVSDGDDLLGDGVNIAARLEALAPPGGIVVSRSVRDHVRDRDGVALADLGEVEVKNIARPVRAFRVLRDGETAKPVRSGRIGKGQLRAALSGVAVLLLALLAAWLTIGDRSWLSSGPPDPGALADERRPALIVLPFANLSGDEGQDYFSDGFTEDITTELARIRGLMIVARNTAFTFKDRAVDTRELSRELGVRYVLEGSARRSGDSIRVNAQLIDAATGTHVWAERFDRPFSDIFVVQDQLVDRIVGTVAAELRQHESKRALAASDDMLEAYDLTSRARLLFRQNTFDSMTEARSLLRRATAIDPSYAEAFSVLAQVENYFFTSRVSDEYARPETAMLVVEAARQAVAQAPDDAFAHAIHGMSMRMTRDYETAEREARLAYELAPNDPEVLATVAVILLSVGDYRETVETLRLAWALDPYLSPIYIGGILSQAHFALGEYQAAKDVAKACLQRTPDDVRCHESLVRALGELGTPEDARQAVDKLLELSPGFTVAEYRRRASRNRNDQAAIDRWAEGLRKAGLPEG